MKKKLLSGLLLITTSCYTAPPPPPPPPINHYGGGVVITPPKTPATTTTTPHTISGSTHVQQMNTLLADANVPDTAKIIAIQGPSDLSLGGIPAKVKPGKNNQLPQVAQATTQAMGMSVTQRHGAAKTTGQLFSDPTVATAYQNFMSAVETVPNFLPLFRRLHIIALHQIYLHLIGIYTTLNMTYISDLKTYMTLEKQYGLNKKTLIINHLVNVIQAQLSQALLILFPGMPQSHGIKGGLAALNQDTVSNPDTLILDIEKCMLAVLKVAPIAPSDITNVISELTNPANIALIAANKNIIQADLTAGIAIINKYGAGDETTNTSSFVQPLIQNQQAATAVIEAIDTILANYTQSQANTNYQTIIDQLTAGKGNSLTQQQMGTFKKTVQQFAFGIPLSEEIEASEQFKTMLTSNDDTVLSADQIESLQGMIGYILQNYEQQSATMLSGIINGLGQLNTGAQTLSPSQKISLQALTTQLLLPQDKNPLALGAVQESDRFVLAYALHVMSVSPDYNFSSDEKTALEALGKQLENMPLTWKELSTAQVAVLQKAFGTLAAYKFEPLTETSMEGKYTKTEQSQLASLSSQITGSTFKSFDIFSKSEQLLLLRMYQSLDSVVETRLEVHKQQGQLLHTIFANDTNLEKALFASISSSQYIALTAIDKLLQANPDKFSFSMVSNTAPSTDPGTSPKNAPVAPRVALTNMFFVPKVADSTQGHTYLSILYSLRDQHFTNPTLLHIIDSMPDTEHSAYKAMLPTITKQNFLFSDLSASQRTLLESDFETMKTGGVPAQPSGKTISKVLLAGTPAARLQTVGTLISSTMNYTKTKTSFLWVLKQYLTFFNVYCATLQEYTSTGYSGLTKFETAAQAVVEQLKNTPLETLNPPVFFYNKETMRGIRLLPQLAKLVENTEIVPYPTFPMTLAVEGSTVDPLDGSTYSNTVNLGTFSFKKFFFIDTTQASDPTEVTDPNGDTQAYQPAKEITGTLPSWIKKTTVPTSGKTTSYVIENAQGAQETVKVAAYNYVYRPNNIPEGLSGFYMNIPIFTQSPLNKDQALIRLFEQPVYAQPAWLNYPGFSTTAPDSIPGVVTLLRGCLGDFQSLIDLNIFDPCMTMIFKSALAVPDGEAGKSTTLQDEIKSDPAMQAAADKCSVYLTAKQAEVNRMQVVHKTGVTTPSSGASHSDGGTMAMPSAGVTQAASIVNNIKSGKKTITSPSNPPATTATPSTTAGGK
jgi:hypothetical protein